MVEILECTLRDGSYSIDFQFDDKDTAIIGKLLEDAGFKYIEIGHGIGLNASNMNQGVAACTDEEYLKAAQKNIKKAQFGMFFIPGIGKMEHIDLAAKYGMDFIRIGTNVPEAEKAEEYIKYAKSKGMMVSSNLMKTYALPPKSALKKAKLVEKWGADIAVVVDSAGGMLPTEITEYVKIFKENLDCKVGFHGHNNLSLANANTLCAIDAGADFVDATLQGMGRSAGNASTEALLLALDKLGYKIDIDLKKILEISVKYIKPLMKKRGIENLDVISGYALFHSKFTPTIMDAAKKKDIDPLDLIIKVSEKTKTNVTEQLANEMAEILKEEKMRRENFKQSYKFFSKDIILEDFNSLDTYEDKIHNILKEMNILSKKSDRLRVVCFAESIRYKKTTISPFLRSNENMIIAQIDLGHQTDFDGIYEKVKDKVDIVAIDKELSSKINSNVTNDKKVMIYNDKEAIVESFINKIEMYSSQTIKPLLLYGYNTYTKKLSLEILEKLWDEVYIYNTHNKSFYKLYIESESEILNIKHIKVDFSEAANEFSAMINFDLEKVSIPEKVLMLLEKGAFIFDAGLGNIDQACIDFTNKNDIQLLRVNMGVGLLFQLGKTIYNNKRSNRKFGKKTIKNVPIASDGIIAPKGTIIVDDIDSPSKIIGVADGKGRLLKDSNNYNDDLKLIKKYILLSRMAPE